MSFVEMVNIVIWTMFVLVIVCSFFVGKFKITRRITGRRAIQMTALLVVFIWCAMLGFFHSLLLLMR